MNALRPMNFVAPVALIALLGTGCQVQNSNKPVESSSSATSPATSLQSLPSLEDTRNQIQGAIENLGQQLTALVPGIDWKWYQEDSGAGCSGTAYQGSDGQMILLRNYVSNIPIPDDKWTQAMDLAQRTAQSLGVQSLTVFKDAPNDHDVQFSNDTGTTLRFGSRASVLITGGTGCRLPARLR